MIQDDQAVPQNPPISPAQPISPPVPPTPPTPPTPPAPPAPPEAPAVPVPVTEQEPKPAPEPEPAAETPVATEPTTVSPPATMPEEPALSEEDTAAAAATIPSFVWNDRTKDIVIWSIAANIILAYITQVGAYLSLSIFLGDVSDEFPVTFDYVSPLTGGIVGGVITAAVLYFLYPKAAEWVGRQSWGKYLNTFFKLMFYPYLAVMLVLTLIGSLANLTGFLVFLIFAAAGHFAFAKTLDFKISHHFTPAPPSVP